MDKKSLYKVGNQVRIIDDLKYGEYYGTYDLICTRSMFDMRNKITKITEIIRLPGGGKFYRLDGSSCNWCEEMFVHVAACFNSVDMMF